MTLKDIVNKDVTHITTCESEPIHIPGSIQPHGVLLVADTNDYIIRYCSANTADIFRLTPEKMLNKSLESVLGHEWQTLLTCFNNNPLQSYPCSFLIHEKKYDIIYRYIDNLVLLEIEPSVDADEERHQLFERSFNFMTAAERATNLRDLCQRVAYHIQQLTGYDRVMIYRFDREYNGEVYAESKRDDLEPFLGLHYPHTDIPAQARVLYVRNLVRMIPDVNYNPVPIVTFNNSSASDVDLSDVGLRSVSPIHIQYLKNMGVHATLTISLLQDERLWGLIACHHYSPKKLPYEKRVSALLQSKFLASQIKVRQVAEEYNVNIVVEAHLQQLLNKINIDEEFALKFEQFNSLLAVANASGAVILYNGKLFEQGIVPPSEKTLALIEWIDKNISSVQFATSALHTRYPDAKSISRYASGILFHALGKVKESCIIWFREEVERTVNWAGNPNEAVLRKATNELAPRSSFALWKEKVRYQSHEWRPSEVNAASRFATTLQNYFHLIHVRQEEQRHRLLNERLQKANQELSNINWITSHDLKEPLRKIRLFTDKIMNEEIDSLSNQLRNSIERIQKSAERMQNLVDDILTYSLMENKEGYFQIVDLQATLNEVLENLHEEFSDKKARLQLISLPGNVRAIPHQMNQLFTNLIANSLKFTKPNVLPVVSVSFTTLRGSDEKDVALIHNVDYFKISLQDNGIGFDPAYSQRLFDIFYRLHHKDEYAGTGIGLAICKKIMENHEGAIVAHGMPGEGAKFDIYLPVG
ncbi:ATP-binding protein [Chryseosolibacter indicus]|uniref:histidine kinase n=1 Tax=Chryseosolibacter indicus TaxID=2782351 RepID=A0ABS5VSW8_9BACT|nr:ATP-binding protein [Chryseosolibacter indicus]MBT1704507.1 GAF domain-containing protein [Chryseosolibacter indicus]